MVKSVNVAQAVDQLWVTPKETHVGSTVSGVRDKVNVSVDLNLWKQYEDYIVMIPLTESIENRLEKYGDEAYGTYSRFSNLEEKSKAMLIDYLGKKYQSLLKRKVAIARQYDDFWPENQTANKQTASEIDKMNLAHYEYHLLDLLESLFTGIPLEGRPEYAGRFPFDGDLMQ
jgi:hypothetical protein